MSAPAATRPLGFLAAALVVLMVLPGAAGAQEPGGADGAGDGAVTPEPDAEDEDPGEAVGETDVAAADDTAVVDPDVVTVLDQSTWVSIGETFDLTLSPGQLPDDTMLTVNVRRALTTRNELHETYFDELSPRLLATPVQQPVGDLPRNGDGDLDVGFEVDPVSFGGNGNGGVHPVEILAESPDGEPLARLITYLLLSPQGEFQEALPVGMVVEMGAPPAQQPDGEVDLDPAAAGHLLERLELLAQLGGSPRVSAAPVPETLDSLVRNGGQESRTVDGLRDGLGPHEVLARPYVDLDLDQWAAVPGLITEAPREADAGAEVIRQLLNREPTPDVWLTGPTVSPEEAGTWVELGVPQAVLDPQAVAGIEAPPESVAPLVQVPGGPVGYVSDEQLVHRIQEATDPLSRHRVVAELAMLWFEQPGDPRPVAVRVPAEGPLDAGQVAAALEEAEGTGVVDLVPITELFARYGPDEDRTPASVELAPKETGDSLAWMPSDLETARSTLEGIEGTIGGGAEDAEDGDDGEDGEEAEDGQGEEDGQDGDDGDDGNETALDQFERALLIAPGADVAPSDRRAYLRSVDGAGDELSDAIHMPDEFRITLTARNSVIPLTITNDLDDPVTVRVELSSPQLEFRDGDQFEIEVPPGSIREDIRVRTRASGSFPLRIALTSPDGQVVFDRTEFDIRSTAISGVGLILSVGAGAFLVLWWVRHWRRTRRDQQKQDREDQQGQEA